MCASKVYGVNQQNCVDNTNLPALRLHSRRTNITSLSVWFLVPSLVNRMVASMQSSEDMIRQKMFFLESVFILIFRAIRISFSLKADFCSKLIGVYIPCIPPLKKQNKKKRNMRLYVKFFFCLYHLHYCIYYSKCDKNNRIRKILILKVQHKLFIKGKL